MRFHVTGLVLFLVGFSANAQVDPGFNGRWTGSGKTIFEMSPAAMKYSLLACDEGTCRRVKPFLCRWSAVGDRLRDDPGDGTCRFSAATRARTRADLLREFDAQLRQEANHDRGFVAAAKRSRRELESMKPIALRSFVLNDAGDVSEFLFDGEHVVRMGPIGAGVEVFARTR